MKLKTINNLILVVILMATLFFYQSSCKSATNEIIKQPTWAVNSIVYGDTNNWSEILSISDIASNSNEHPPMGNISIKNISTNTFHCWTGFYGEKYSKIELLDSNDVPVDKTIAGKQIGAWASYMQIKQMVENRFQELNFGKVRTDGFVTVRPSQNVDVKFSIPDLFQLKKTGQYTLKVKTCLIQRIGGEHFAPDLKITWMPEIVAKIQMQNLTKP